MSLIDDLARDVRHGLWALGRSPGFTVTAILSLGLGLGVATTAFTYIDAIRLRALPYPDGGRLVALTDTVSEDDVLRNSVHYTSFQVWASGRRRSVDALAGITVTTGTLTHARAVENLNGAGVSAGYFAIFGVPLVVGRPFGRDDDRFGAPSVALISERLWRSQFGGDPHVLGEPLAIGEHRPTIVGVVSARFHDPLRDWDYWVPLAPTEWERQRDFRSARIIALARLATGHPRSEAEAELAAISQTDASDRHVYSADLRSDVFRSLHGYDVLLGIIALTVLLTACANLSGLLLVRQVARYRELAVRTALGAVPGRIARQLVTEGVLLAATGGVLGAIAAVWGVQVSGAPGMALGGLSMGLDPHIDARVLAFLAILTLVCGAAISLIPQLRLARGEMHRFLQHSAPNMSLGLRQSRTRHLFVMAQLACASLLVGTAGGTAATYLRVARAEPGFNPDPVVGIRALPPGDRLVGASATTVEAFTARLQPWMASVAGVKGTAAWGWLTSPRPRAEQLPRTVEDTPHGIHPLPIGALAVLATDTAYFNVLGVPLIHGRRFNSGDVEGAPGVAIVDEYTAERWWPRATAVGKRVRVGSDQEPWLTIVGVVGSTRNPLTEDLLQDRRPQMLFRPWRQSTVSYAAFLYMRSAAPQATAVAATLRRSLQQQLFPGAIIDVWPMAELYHQTYMPIRRNMFGMLLLAAFGLALALMGVYGVVAYAVGQRTREFGIRLALGARRAAVIRLALSEAGVMAVIGLGIGAIGAFALRQGIRAALFVASTSWNPIGIAVAGVVFLLVVLLASYLPARRATRVDPVIALRSG